ncbi:MAG: hypothetical protein GDA38_27205 [Hormoscilla sp. SP12CHS1]|nr:hypothetical protein [Hormoscilla sp. SP12CHS1]
MADDILITGDEVKFDSSFGKATVTVLVKPVTLAGSGKGKINGKPICVEGDEKKVIVPGCLYTTKKHTIPGTGTLTIEGLGGDQKAKKTKSGGKPVLLKGGKFKAKFQKMVPAQQPPPGPGSPIPDLTLQYSGNGSFETTNQKVKGT